MNGATIKDKDVLLRHLTVQRPEHGVQRFSAFVAGLGDARLATGRDHDTGEKLTGQVHSCWLGAIGYLILLDQIGKCFKPKGITPCEGKPPEKALMHFANLPAEDVYALYALRCALAHDYGLSNVAQASKDATKTARDAAKYTHAFALVSDAHTPLMTIPIERWDGVYKTIAPDNQTVINVEALGDLIEEVVAKILAMSASDELEIILPGGEDELKGRYSFLHYV